MGSLNLNLEILYSHHLNNGCFSFDFHKTKPDLAEYIKCSSFFLYSNLYNILYNVCNTHFANIIWLLIKTPGTYFCNPHSMGMSNKVDFCFLSNYKKTQL